MLKRFESGSSNTSGSLRDPASNGIDQTQARLLDAQADAVSTAFLNELRGTQGGPPMQANIVETETTFDSNHNLKSRTRVHAAGIVERLELDSAGKLQTVNATSPRGFELHIEVTAEGTLKSAKAKNATRPMTQFDFDQNGKILDRNGKVVY